MQVINRKWYAATNYVVITPVRDEEAFIGYTYNSMLAQTVKPIEWVIVNDGSRDRTGEIIEGYARSLQWIKDVHRRDRGHRKAGGGVIEAFYDGFAAISTDDWDFIVKLDGDLSFSPEYFERCLKRFHENARLGIGGGDIYHEINGRLVLEKVPNFHVRGATKIYRRACWQDIGRLVAAPGWDGLDELKANMMGWETCSFHDLHLIHHRYTGSADGSWRNSVKNGLSDYISGYHPLFMLLKCLKRLANRPFLINAAGHAYGFLSGYLKKVSQVEDPELVRYIRQQQLRKLTFRTTILK